MSVGALVRWTFVLLVLVGSPAAWFLFHGGGGPDTPVLIPRGARVSAIADRLAAEGVVADARAFKFLLRLTGASKRVRAGEFAFAKPSSLAGALSTLYYAEPILHAVTIPEGWTVRMIAKALAEKQLVDENKFLGLALSADAPKKRGIHAPTMEGFLYPNTYKFSRTDGEERIIDRMYAELQKRFTPDLRDKAKQMHLTFEEVVTFASIVEKETGVGGERAVVASVFHNRLKKGMKLQSDPTTIYGIANFDGNLRRKDLEHPTPYNTYTIKALPPGPIASPGIAAISAVLSPATTNYLYFVGNNQGEHVFSETLEQHNRMVDYWQRGAGRRRINGGKKH